MLWQCYCTGSIQLVAHWGERVVFSTSAFELHGYKTNGRKLFMPIIVPRLSALALQEDSIILVTVAG
jgi:hypothetical protein